MKKKILALVLLGLSLVTPIKVNAQTTNQFIANVKEDVIQVAYEKNIWASVMMAQAILESGNGNSGLAKNYNNFFGMKGAGVSMKTSEQSGGVYYRTSSSFQKFKTPKDGFRAYANNFYRLSRVYSKYLNATNPNSAALALDGVYATSDNYGSRLIGIMKKYNLYALDAEVVNRKEKAEEDRKKEAELIESFKSKRKKQAVDMIKKAKQLYDEEYKKINFLFSTSTDLDRDNLFKGNANLYYSLEEIATLYDMDINEAEIYKNEFISEVRFGELFNSLTMKSITGEMLVKKLEFNKYLFNKLTKGVEYAKLNIVAKDYKISDSVIGVLKSRSSFNQAISYFFTKKSVGGFFMIKGISKLSKKQVELMSEVSKKQFNNQSKEIT